MRTGLIHSSIGILVLGFSGIVKADSVQLPIQNLSGCFNVSFEYIEDGKNDQTIDGLYEWIAQVPGSVPGAQYSYQHVGIVDGKAFKHWHELWEPRGEENGTPLWYQKVTGPFGDFRYECTAALKFNQWRCSVQNAPKPRRDAKRTDYKTLDRENTLQFTPTGWVQAENNLKKDQNGNAVSNELGWNKYRRVDESHCQAAKDFLAHRE